MFRISKLALVLLTVSLTMVGIAVGQPAHAQSQITIHVLTQQQSAMTNDEMQSAAADFMAANPNIKVEIEFIDYDSLHDKFVTSMATNPPPYDVIMTDVIWYPEFVKSGYIADVTSRVTPDMLNNAFKTAWNVVTVGGKLWGMPWLLDTKYLYYNEPMLKQAGFDHPPATWEDLVQQATVIKQK